MDLANIIEPRVQEIFQLIRAEVARLGYPEPAGGYVLSGGAVTMPGMLEIAQIELENSVRIAVPDFIGVRDPSYTNGVGIIQYVYKYSRQRSTSAVRKTTKKAAAPEKNKVGLMERFKNWISEFI